MIPKFSIRQMLFAMVALGVLSACMAGASRGNRPLFALSVAIFSTVIPFLVYAAVHWFAFALAQLSASIFGSKALPEPALGSQLGSQPIVSQPASHSTGDSKQEGLDD